MPNLIRRMAAPLIGKAVTGLERIIDWYNENGYYKLAASHASDSRGHSGYLSPEQALQVTVFFACVKIIAEDVGSLPFFVFRRRGNMTEKAPDHALYRRIHDAANPETNAMTFREAVTAHALMTGDGYALIERSARDSDRIIALYNVQPGQIRKDRDSRKQRVFLYKDGNSPEKTLASDRVLNLMGFSFDGQCGANVTQLARRTLRLALDQNDYASNFFGHDVTPGVVLRTGAWLEPPQIEKVKNAFIEGTRRHGVAVAHGGVDIEAISKSNKDSQLKEQREFQIAEVCRPFRMPPHKVADLMRATFSNIEQQSIDYYANTLRPWLVRWEQTVARVCLANQTEYFVEHSIEGLLRGDFATQTAGFAKLLEKGVYSINEVRAYLNLNPVEGGDEHFIQLNMQNVIGAGEAPEYSVEPPAQPGPAKAQLVRVKSANLD